MTDSQGIHDIDLYDLLGIEFNASIQEVKSAYRKKALTCHPDKNPDNPKATELFHQLSRALEILIDASARAAYDKVLNAKKAAVLRNRELDSRRKKLKEDLEARERKADEARKHCSHDKRTDEEKLQAEIERLRKEGSKQVEEEVAYVSQQILQEKLLKNASPEYTGTSHRLRIHWEANKSDPDNGGYNHELLHRMLSKYGEITALIVSAKKKGSALVEFATKEAAEMAQELEIGLTKNPLKLKVLGKEGTNVTSSSRTVPRTVFQNPGEQHTQGIFAKDIPCDTPCPLSPNNENVPYPDLEVDFESLVFQRLRQAEERRRITEKIILEQSLDD